ncbi:hypothetical protein GZH53_15705 [Flavihumibacter sp. R14]|nr:hypothetical protein [Flavihumibacter soli]
MRPFPLAALFFLNLTIVFGQQVVNNKLTPEHQNVAGTKISLISPKGFHKAANFLGLQQDQSGSTMMVIAFPGPFSQVSSGLTKEGLLSQGVEVKEIQNLTVNSLPAILVTGEQNANGKAYTKYVLAFGTETETIMINCAVPKNLGEIGKEVKASLLTVFYEPGKKIDPLETVDYEIDLKGSKLKFASSVANVLTFNLDGKTPNQSPDRTSLIVAKAFSNVAISDKKLFALNRIKNLPVEILKINSVEAIDIDGISGFEILADGKGKKTGDAEKIYQVILFSDSLYYLMIGTTNQDFEMNISEIKRVTRSFKRK